MGRGIEIKAGRGRGHEGNERVKQRFRSSDEDEGRGPSERFESKRGR